MIDIQKLLNEEADIGTKATRQAGATVKNAKSTIGNAAGAVGGALKKAVNKDTYKKIGNSIKDASKKGAENVLNTGKKGLKAAGEKAIHPVQTAKDAVKGAAKGAANAVKGAVNTVLQENQNIPQEMMIEPSKILAKLHLSGKQQGESNDIVIINTGIINDTQNGPDKVDKTDFNLTSKDGVYQIGLVTDITYKVDPIKELDIQDLQDQKKKVKDKFKIDENIEIESRLEELTKELEGKDISDPEVKKLNDEKSNLEKANEEMKPIQEQIRKKLQEKAKEYGVKEEEKDTNDQLYSKLIPVIVQKNLSKAKYDAIREKSKDSKTKDAIDKYMKQFAGDKYTGVDEKKTFNSCVEVPKGFSGLVKDSQKYISDFKIIGLDEKQIESLINPQIEEAQKKQWDYDFSTTICFRYNFTIKTK